MPTLTGGPLNGTIMSHAMWAPDGRTLAGFYATALGTTVTETYPDEHGDEAACGFHARGVMYLLPGSRPARNARLARRPAAWSVEGAAARSGWGRPMSR